MFPKVLQDIWADLQQSSYGKRINGRLRTTVPVAIHLDHGSSFEKCKAAIDAGFTSVMIDASHHPFEENVEITSKVVDYAHAT